MEEFRNQLPETAKLMVCKNTLVNLASQRVPGWVELEPATKVRVAVLCQSFLF